jgi:hypothetical protein
MELPIHSCIGCAYFFIDASKPISFSERKIISSKNWNSRYFSFDYFKVTCSREKLARFSISINKKEDILAEITGTNKCNVWMQFDEGISATDAENRRFSIKSINWSKWPIILAILALGVSIIALIYSLISFYS